MTHQELREEILRLKKEKNALIMAHYYQRDEIQEIADFIGDSLALARPGGKDRCRHNSDVWSAFHG